jgi:5-hydroxyisourate hydrolase-like protein (transthyretin family)
MCHVRGIFTAHILDIVKERLAANVLLEKFLERGLIRFEIDDDRQHHYMPMLALPFSSSMSRGS